MHWTLAIISPWNGLVYWLDPLGAKIKINLFAEKIFTEGIKQFISVHRKDIKKIKKNAYIRWEQPQVFPPICTYSSEDIDEMRDLWIKYVLDHEPDEEDS